MTPSDQKSLLTVACPDCGKGYRIPAESRGRQLTCKGCGKPFTMEPVPPSKETSPPAPGPAAEEDACLVLGRLALKYRFVVTEQLKEALAQQRRERSEGKKSLLGSVLLRRELITQKQLDFLLSVQMMMDARKLDVQFGAMAVKNGFVSGEDVEAALQEQERLFKEKRSVRMIGEMLVDRGHLTAEQRDAILERQRRLAPPQEEPHRDGAPEIAGTTAPASGSFQDAELYADLFEVDVSSDGLSATVTPTRPIPETMTAEGLRAFLKTHEISYGLVTNEEIEAFLHEKARTGEAFTIAEGTPPEPGKDAEIRHHFNTDPMKVGTINEGGNIDFKDKGEIPQVKSGDLLAERIPPQEGTAGTTVTGRSIPPPKPRNLKLRKGKGTTVSDDGLRLFAEAGGRPEISADGKVFVFSEHKITGDVDLKTGHVDFEGDIHVNGTVNKGFRVRGGSLTANEVVGADLDIRGDVMVTGGVIGATIRIGGNLRARYLHKTRVLAFGNVVLDKEVIDSDVETSGAFVVKNGPVLSSRVTAKKGIETLQVGSSTSNPCVLTVGTDDRVKHEIQEIQTRIEEAREIQKAHLERNEALEAEKNAVALQLGEIAQMQDQCMVKKRQLQERMGEIRQGGDKALLRKAEGLVKALDEEFRGRESTLEGLFAKEDGIDEAMAENTRKIREIEARIETLEGEIEHLAEWARGEEPVPVVKVHGNIFPYTTIKARNTGLTLPEGHKGIVIKETRVLEPQDGKEWRLRLSPLKT